MALSADGLQAATLNQLQHNILTVYENGTPRTVQLPGARVDAALNMYKLAYSPNGRRLAVISPGSTVAVFDVKRWEVLAELSGHESFMDLAWIDDATLASCAMRLIHGLYG